MWVPTRGQKRVSNPLELKPPDVVSRTSPIAREEQQMLLTTMTLHLTPVRESLTEPGARLVSVIFLSLPPSLLSPSARVT